LCATDSAGHGAQICVSVIARAIGAITTGAIGAILLVSASNIADTLRVLVTERRAEIALYRALGATAADVWTWMLPCTVAESDPYAHPEEAHVHIRSPERPPGLLFRPPRARHWVIGVTTTVLIGCTPAPAG
jgi:hypothetical protein